MRQELNLVLLWTTEISQAPRKVSRHRTIRPRWLQATHADRISLVPVVYKTGSRSVCVRQQGSQEAQARQKAPFQSIDCRSR